MNVLSTTKMLLKRWRNNSNWQFHSTTFTRHFICRSRTSFMPASGSCCNATLTGSQWRAG